jgi:hypothetical protein
LNETAWIYVVWFRDLRAAPEDEDRDWVAVLGISAPSAEEAQAWGDHLARGREERRPEDRFLTSEVHLPSDPRYSETTDWSRTPRIVAGVEADDETIGW